MSTVELLDELTKLAETNVNTIAAHQAQFLASLSLLRKDVGQGSEELERQRQWRWKDYAEWRSELGYAPTPERAFNAARELKDQP